MNTTQKFSLLWLVLLQVCACSGTDATKRSRVVLITLDTLRYDRFEGTQEHASAMPLTRAHAERGVVFHRYYTVSGVTQPAHATLFTGLQPWQHGITRNGIVFSDSLPSVVEAFAKHGYEAQAVVASFPVTSRFGFDRGFDSFTEDFSQNLNPGKALWEEHWKIESGSFFSTADEINRHALDALDRARGDKQFFWFHYFDPHAPYGASSGEKVIRKKDVLKAASMGEDEAALRLAEARRLYDADVRTMDAALDRILKRLAVDETRYETHIMVVSDHGESLGEDGALGHGSELNEAELRVPAFLISPRIEPAARHDLASTIDLAPTLLAMAGITGPDMKFAGRDLTKAADEPGRAFAIRRTARDADQQDQRIDGSRVPLADPRFAQIDADGTIVRGNREGLLTSEAQLDGDRPEAIVERFSTFERALEQLTKNAEPLTPEVRRGLEALGYIE